MSDLLSLAGWYILPDVRPFRKDMHTNALIAIELITGWMQTAYYAVWYRAGDPKPRPGSRRHVSHRTRIYILVILAYLLYTVVEADWKLQQRGTFYDTLGVPLDVDERVILSRFRRLTVQFHPDKIATDENRSLAEAYYVHLKQCRDVLADPARRFAYDRFGPEVQDWRECKTYFDFVYRGVRETAMYYVGTASVLAVFGLVGYLKYASFWRYIAIASLFTFEMYTMTRPQSPWLITHLLNPIINFYGVHPPYVQFQVLALLRKLLISFFIALSQVGPHLVPDTVPVSVDADARMQQLDRLASVAATSEQEANRLMALELMPFAGDEATLGELRSAMRQWLMDNAVKANPQVRDAMGRVLQPRERPAGP